MKQPVVLRIYKGDTLETVRQFENAQIVIGRNADVQVELNDPGVALLHAMIEDRGNGYYISDLGSPTGTFKNGKRILEDKLESGDKVKIGAYRIEFYVGVPKPAAPPKMVAEAPVAPVEPPVSINFSAPIVAAPPEKPAPQPPPEAKVTKPKPITQAAPPAAPSLPQAPKVPAAQVPPSAKTFAPPSPYKDLNEVIKPYKGSVVEVIVAWGDKVLSSNHFKTKGSVFISSNEDADVIVPILSSRSRYELLKIGTQVTVCLTQEMTGELVRDGETVSLSDLARQNKLRNVGTHFEIDLRQGEMVRLGLQDNLISLFVRYVADTPKPLVAPVLDMTSSEVTGIVLALAISAIMALYMNIYTPTPLLEDEAQLEEPIRKAIVRFNPLKHDIVEVKEEVKQEKKVAPPVEKKVAQAMDRPRQTPNPTVEKQGDPGKSGDLAKAAVKAKTKTAAVRPGGAIKTSSHEGANMKAEKPDPSKMGLLGVFSKKGTQAALDKSYSGSGELQGMADSATGYAGAADDRAGANLGSRIKDMGGGKGEKTVGIAGVGTTGRGSGTTGYGSGGIGQKGNVQINVGGQEGEFSGGMDKEAIRRVIRDHIREIRNCYEQELQRSPGLYGKIVLEWDIEEGGRVSRCVAKSNSMGNEAVARCITSRLKTWKFPDPPKDMVGRVSYPFLFSSL